MDPEVLAAMLPMMTEYYANAGSATHAAGRQVAERVQIAQREIASLIGASEDEIVFTSGATESNNLALFGTCLHPRQKRRKIVSVVSEHKAVLDPLARLANLGFEVKWISIAPNESLDPGRLDLNQLAEAVDDQTAIVSVMLANNEIGTIQPLRQIADICHRHDCLLHTDAAQAFGRLPINVDEMDVDLLSFSGHKIYGPKGIGGLFVRRRGRRVKLQSQIVGGGQQQNLRSGTLNSAGIVGMAAALHKCYQLNDWFNEPSSVGTEELRLAGLRRRMLDQLTSQLEIQLNGPTIEIPHRVGDLRRLACNLNLCFSPIEGQSLMLELPQLAMSSGSACTSADERPSHVLEAIGLTVEQARSSLRFGFGRFNFEDEIDFAAASISAAVYKLRKLL
jgi:cysteine desulfurase